MTSTEVVLPSGSVPSLPITTSSSSSSASASQTVPQNGESPPAFTPTPTHSPIPAEDGGEGTSNGFNMEESSSPLSNPSPQDLPPSTNPSSPRDAKPDVPDNSEGVKMERSESSSTPQPPPTRGNRKPKKTRHIVLYNDLPDKTEEAQAKFQLMESCTYQPKSLADSGQEEELMSCDCRPEYEDGTNHACSHNCINAETFVECVDGDSNCGGQCQNQRFQKREYADVSVIQTEMKGYGLRANTPMEPGTFIYEYVGEVIGESQFRKRREQYGKEDIKHFYFMSIKVGEYIDATKKGCLARFCNHSCNPNCMVEKWVVGGKLRMGIFAKVKIEAGEELTFDYNVDRYGADPQKCFCGEPNCIGYIGGKTQTEASTKLPTLYLEALGLDDDDAWLTATSRKAQKKKKNDDGDYMYKAKTRALSHDGVPKVMGTLMQASKQWIVVKLLDRIEASEDPKVLPRVLEMHGYKIFNKLLADWRTVTEIVLPILQIMHKWPRITKNKISSSKIEGTVKDLASASPHPKVKELAAELAESWGALEMGYRIPRRQKDSNDSPNPEFERRSRRRSRSRSRSPEQEKPVNIPTGPKNSKPQFIPKPRSFPKDAPKGPRMPNIPLPQDWKMYKSPNGRTYYHNTRTGATQWDHPGKNPPPTPTARPLIQNKDPKVTNILQLIEDEVVRETEERRLMRLAAQQQQQQQPVPTAAAAPVETEEEKAKKLLHHERRVKFAYYNIVKETTAIYLPKMGKAEIKKRNEEITRLCARKDMKKTGLKTPTDISSEKFRQIRKFTQDFMRSLWKKMKAHYAAKKAREAAKGSKPEGDGADDADKDTPAELDADKDISGDTGFESEVDAEGEANADDALVPREDEAASIEPSPNTGSASPKRKRSQSEDDDEVTANGAGSPKRSRINEKIVLSSAHPPPPPPPPPGSPPAASPFLGSPSESTPAAEFGSPKRKRDNDNGTPLSAAEEDTNTYKRPLKRPRSLSKSRSPSPRSVSDTTVQKTA